MRISSYRVTVQMLFLIFINLGLVIGMTGLIYPLFYCYASPCADAACPLGVLEHAAIELRHELVAGLLLLVYLFGFLGILAMLFGRAFCGFACPIGALQDCISRALKRKSYRSRQSLKIGNMPLWASKLEPRYIKYLILLAIPPSSYLTLRVLFTELCPVGGLTATLPTLALYPDKFVPTGMFPIKMSILLLLLVLIFAIGRGWCRFFCPLGALFAPFNKLSLTKLVRDDKCTHCDKCAKACPMLIPEPGAKREAECILCGRCIDACPTGELKLTFLGRRPKDNA